MALLIVPGLGLVIVGASLGAILLGAGEGPTAIAAPTSLTGALVRWRAHKDQATRHTSLVESGKVLDVAGGDSSQWSTTVDMRSAAATSSRSELEAAPHTTVANH